MRATLKIRKIGRGWGWQLLSPSGDPLCTGTMLKKTATAATDDFAKVYAYCVGGPVMLHSPEVGQTVKHSSSLQIWRHS